MHYLGMVKEKVLPSPSLDSTDISPPESSTAFLTMASPTPVDLDVLGEATVSKIWKIFWKFFGSIPIPHAIFYGQRRYRDQGVCLGYPRVVRVHWSGYRWYPGGRRNSEPRNRSAFPGSSGKIYRYYSFRGRPRDADRPDDFAADVLRVLQAAS